MNHEDIIRMAREAGFNVEQGFLLRVTGIDEDLERFAALVAAAEREKVAAWMMAQGYEACQARDVGVQPAECAGAIRARSST